MSLFTDPEDLRLLSLNPVVIISLLKTQNKCFSMDFRRRRRSIIHTVTVFHCEQTVRQLMDIGERLGGGGGILDRTSV